MHDEDGSGNAGILKEALERFHLAEEAEAEIRKKALEELKFESGDQWPPNIRQSRELEYRPCITVNQMPKFVRQVTNDARMNRPSIKVIPTDDSTIDVAKIYEGMCRNIQAASHADVAYDTACAFQTKIGFGYFRVLTEYCDEKTNNQDIKIKWIKNPFSVYLDPDATEPDKSDIQWGFIVSDVLKSDFKKNYTGELGSSYELASTGDNVPGWVTEDHIRIAEYFEIVEKPNKLYELADGVFLDSEALKHMRDTGGHAEIVSSRDAPIKHVIWRKITAFEVLEEKEWPGKYIPIITVLGEEIDIDGKRVVKGMVRDTMDAQRMYNYWSPLALDTPIPTPSGWSTMGKIFPGDEVFDENGKICKVIGESPIHVGRECFKVMFDDHTSIIADKEHKWTVEERGARKSGSFDWKDKTVITGDLVPSKHFIYRPDFIDTNEKDLPLHPYLLGVWLGDGNSRCPQITQHKNDVGDIAKNIKNCGYSIGNIRKDKRNDVCYFTILGIKDKFSSLGLLGNKHIPQDYLRASKEQRLELLRGLMDSDGSISEKTKLCEFTTIYDGLRNEVSDLLNGLGIKAKFCVRDRNSTVVNGRECKTKAAYQFSFSCPTADTSIFKLDRKLNIQKKKKSFHLRRTKRFGIVSVDKVKSVPVKCIAVDGKSHLFLAGYSMIPTHNTCLTEAIALAPKAPFIMVEGQDEGYERFWQTANTKAYPYLVYKPISVNGQLAPPPQRNTAEPPVQAMAMAIRQASEDMKSTTGIHNASLGISGNETSGKAIIARKHEGDTANFHYIDNLSRAIRYLGCILVDLIPKIYDAPRVMRILHEDGTSEMVKINQPHEENGVKKMYDMTYGRYDVEVTTGPSFLTKRVEAAESMAQFAQAYPPLMQVAGDLMVRNMDWPGADKVAERLKTMLPPQLQEAENGQPPVPPQVQAQLQQQGMMLEQLTKALNDAHDQSDAKAMELASKEKIATQNNETNLVIAELKSSMANNMALFREELAHLRADADRQHALQVQQEQLKMQAQQQQAAPPPAQPQL